MTRQAMQFFVGLLLTVALVAGCGGEDGSPSDAWVGKTFLLDTPSYPAIYWTEPGGFGGDIGAYVPQFLIGVEKGAVKDELKINLATALEGAQDLCIPTTQVTASGANYPLLDIVASTFPMRIWDPEASRYVSTTGTNVTFRNLLPGNSTTVNGFR